MGFELDGAQHGHDVLAGVDQTAMGEAKNLGVLVADGDEFRTPARSQALIEYSQVRFCVALLGRGVLISASHWRISIPVYCLIPGVLDYSVCNSRAAMRAGSYSDGFPKKNLHPVKS